MVNIQFAIDETLLNEINKASKYQGSDLAQIIREALQAWLKRREGLRFEQEWIAALKKNPDDASRAEMWSEVQTWSES
jgi:metal-responsive CopG/Arc/MetJ family transcriptional regulator